MVVADPGTFVTVIKITAQGMCVRLVLGSPFAGTDTFGLTLPQGWGVWRARTARWPSSIAPCTTTGTPNEAMQASSGTGTVTFRSRDVLPDLVVDVDAVLNFPQGDSGASELETLQATGIAATYGCG
jgi:hypothetical protein